MLMYYVSDLRAQYRDIARWVCTDGAKIAPRGQLTYELLDVALELPSP